MNTAGSYRVHSLKLGPMDNFLYVIEDVATQTAALIDPAWDLDRLIGLCQEHGLTITHVLLTHSHGDHINALSQAVERLAPEVHVLRAEAEFWGQTPEGSILHEDGDEILLGQTRIRIIHTPGHTPGSTCYDLGDDLIAGDTVFVYGCGRCDLNGGDPRAMHASLTRLQRELKPHVRIHPGHNYGIHENSTMGEQAAGNPFMHFDDVEAFVHYRMVAHDQTRNSPYGPEPRQRS